MQQCCLRSIILSYVKVMVSEVSNLETSTWQGRSIALSNSMVEANLVDRMQSGWQQSNAEGHMIPSVLSN